MESLSGFRLRGNEGIVKSCQHLFRHKFSVKIVRNHVYWGIFSHKREVFRHLEIIFGNSAKSYLSPFSKLAKGIMEHRIEISKFSKELHAVPHYLLPICYKGLK